MTQEADSDWKPVLVVGYTDKYEVSTSGHVRNTRTGKILTPMRTGANRKGGQRSKVRFSTDPRIDVEVGALVLTAFLRPRAESEQVMHKDDDSTNNTLANLQWGTAKDNMLDCAIKKRWDYQKLGPEQVAEIFKRRTAGESGKKLAFEFGVSQQLVCDIYKKRSALAKMLFGQ